MPDVAPHGLDGRSAPAYVRVANTFRDQIVTGRLRPGEQVPPTRTVAEEMGISRWVVAQAYDQLKAEGYLIGRMGSGTVVADTPARSSVHPTQPEPQAPPSASASASEPPPPHLFDLSPALPDVTSFPRSSWRAALNRALVDVTDAELAHPDQQGAPALRHTLAGYLRRVRGMELDPDRIRITQGVRASVALICRQLREHGARRVAIEDPSWPRLAEIAAGNGLEVMGVPVDDGGVRVPDLVSGSHRVDAVFVTPTHQFPMGMPLAAGRRGTLIEWARTRGVMIVEDDYDAEFRYDRLPVGALAALAPDQVVYLGSVSKSLSPGVGVGWLATPPRFAGLLTERNPVDGLPSIIDQRALASWIEHGGYDRHLRRQRRRYQRRRDALASALTSMASKTSVTADGTSLLGTVATGMDAGLHLIRLLPEGVDEGDVVVRCRAAGAIVMGLSDCRRGPGPAGLVLGYANVPESQAQTVSQLIHNSTVSTD
jgi:GntR family transcriptional regulator/MocR family aminotransferase